MSTWYCCQICLLNLPVWLKLKRSGHWFHFLCKIEFRLGLGEEVVEKQKPVKKPISMIMWVNHLSLLPGDPSVNISYNAINSGAGGGLTGLVIEYTTTGDEAQGGGNKVVQKALDIPPGFRITGVRVGYENSNVRSFITQVRPGTGAESSGKHYNPGTGGHPGNSFTNVLPT